MKTLILVSLFLVACGQSGGTQTSPSSAPASTPSSTSLPSTQPTQQPPTTVSNPTPPPIAQPAQPQPPLFSCIQGGSTYAVCTGGNLGTSLGRLNLTAIFTGGNPQESIASYSIANGVIANANGVCAQPYGCFSQSTCVTAQILIPSTSQVFTVTSCGNTFNLSTNTLEDR